MKFGWIQQRNGFISALFFAGCHVRFNKMKWWDVVSNIYISFMYLSSEHQLCCRQALYNSQTSSVYSTVSSPISFLLIKQYTRINIYFFENTHSFDPIEKSGQIRLARKLTLTVISNTLAHLFARTKPNTNHPNTWWTRVRWQNKHPIQHTNTQCPKSYCRLCCWAIFPQRNIPTIHISSSLLLNCIHSSFASVYMYVFVCALFYFDFADGKRRFVLQKHSNHSIYVYRYEYNNNSHNLSGRNERRRRRRDGDEGTEVYFIEYTTRQSELDVQAKCCTVE